MNSGSREKTSLWLLLAAMPLLTLCAFFGSTVHAQAQAQAPAGADHTLLHLLSALLVVVVFAQLVGQLFKRFGQPPVVGEMFAGIILGPSLLGRYAPGLSTFLLPSSVVPYLRAISQIGVVIYMFLVGLELDVKQLRQKAGTALVVSASGIAVPLLLGSMFASFFYARVAPAGVPTFVFGAFFCVALSVTAFPVLARIVAERNLEKTMMGTLALTCAAADDIAAWCLLSVVVSFAHADASGGMVTVALAATYVVFMIFLIRPLFMRMVRREETTEQLSRFTLAILIGSLLVSALVTEAIGIHALFGSFLLGAIIPNDSQLARRTLGKLEDVIAVLFLPIFFAFTGLRTELSLLSGASAWGLCAIVIAIAMIGKAGGVSIASRLTGLPWRTALGLGALMNTRGLMELIVLNVGLDLGIISPALFAMMVVMALVTTCSAGPILHLLEQRRTGTVPAGSAPTTNS